MSEWLKKSNNNIQAAGKLIDRDFLYSSSVHCSYYSSFQIILHILYKKFPNEWSEYRKELKNENENIQASHQVSINFIQKMLMVMNFELGRSFSKNIQILKTNRHKSDYREIEIDKNQASKSKEIALEINSDLKKAFL